MHATVAQIEFANLAKTHWKDLYQYAYRLCRNSQTAQDLVQDSLIRAWRGVDRLQNPAAIKGWLKTIGRRNNARRFERVQPELSAMTVDEIGAERITYDTSTEAFALRRALHALPEKYSGPLIMQVLHGYSQQEIADRLGLTSAGVGSRLFRARQRLRDSLGDLM